MAETSTRDFLIVFQGKKLPFGYYLLGSLIIIICSFIGQFPTFFFLPDTLPVTDNPMDVFKDLDTNLTLFLLLFPSLTAFFGFLLVVKKLHEQTLDELTTVRSSIDWKRVFFGFSFWAGLSALIVFIDVSINPQDFRWNFEAPPFFIMLFIACLFIPFQSALEEWIFRAYLMQGFARLTKSRLLTLVLTSVIFGSLHLFNPEIGKLGYGLLAYYIGTGFFFGLMTLMDEGAELAIGFHVANNLVTAILVTADWTAFQTASLYKDISNPSLFPELILFLGLIYPVTLIYLARKYQWKDWQNKILGTVHDA